MAGKRAARLTSSAMADRLKLHLLTGSLLLALLLAGAGWSTAASADSGLRVVPFPGTPDAAPKSDVIFSALLPAELRSVTVTGSRSGRHRGRLERLPAGAGTAFIPDRQFQAGERVQVTAALSSPQAGTASGDPGATQLRFSFGVSEPASPVSLQARRSSAGGIPTESWMSTPGYGATQSFHSEPHLQPPVVKVTSDPDTTSGDIFIGPQNSPQVGPMILNPRGQLVWFDALPPGPKVGNVEVERYRGRPVLTWWYGRAGGDVVTNPSGDVIMNRSYQRVATVHAGYGYATDEHDFQLTSTGTAYLDSEVLTEGNLSGVGGPARGRVADYVLQEVDVKTGKVLWEWHALGHVPIDASYQGYTAGEPFYDYFHLNSIQQLPSGNLLISARDTCALYEISRSTGKVIWTLGGKHSSFQMGPGTTFWWQHDARLHGSTLSLFDDGALPQRESQSSAEFLRVDTATRKVSLIKRFTHTPPLLAGAGGSTELLPNGNVFVGWGTQPEFTEFSPSGRQIFNGTYPLRVGSYRAFRFPWVGRPDTRPALAVSPGTHGRVKVYVSWNGATQVRSWRVLGGSSPHRLRPLGVTAPRSGFETTITVTSRQRYFAVQALGHGKKVLGTSAPSRG